MTEPAPTNVRSMLPTLAAGSKPTSIVPTTFDDCYRLARLLAASGMVPDAYKDNPDATCVAVMQGLEVGLSPMAAIQSIAVINGRPCLWGDGLLGVVRASGLLETFEEVYDEKTETATCHVKRRGEKPLSRSFSLKDAKAAGLLDKKGPWQTYRRRMCQMRARSWALRDGFADVLKGLRSAEEESDARPLKDITPAAELMDLPDIPDIQAAISEAEVSEAPDKEPDTEADIGIADEAGFLAKLESDRALCDSIEEVTELREANADIIARLSKAGQKRAAEILAVEE